MDIEHLKGCPELIVPICGCVRTLLAKQELMVKRYREALEDIKKVTEEYTIKGQYKGDLRLLWVYEKCEKALEEKGS